MFLLIFVTVMFVNVQAGDWYNFRYPIVYHHWTEIEFQKGDVLECQLVGPIARQVLLATSDRNVIYFIGDQKSFKGHVKEESWQKYHIRQGDKQTRCRNAGRKFTRDEAV